MMGLFKKVGTVLLSSVLALRAADSSITIIDENAVGTKEVALTQTMPEQDMRACEISNRTSPEDELTRVKDVVCHREHNDLGTKFLVFENYRHAGHGHLRVQAIEDTSSQMGPSSPGITYIILDTRADENNRRTTILLDEQGKMIEATISVLQKNGRKNEFLFWHDLGNGEVQSLQPIINSAIHITAQPPQLTQTKLNQTSYQPGVK